MGQRNAGERQHRFADVVHPVERLHHISEPVLSLMWYTQSSGYTQYAITVFNWANCNTSGQWKVIGYLGAAGSTFNMDNLNNYTYQSPAGSTLKLYHTITSIGIRCVICS